MRSGCMELSAQPLSVRFTRVGSGWSGEQENQVILKLGGEF